MENTGVLILILRDITQCAQDPNFKNLVTYSSLFIFNTIKYQQNSRLITERHINSAQL